VLPVFLLVRLERRSPCGDSRLGCPAERSEAAPRQKRIGRALTIPVMWAKMMAVLPSVPNCRVRLFVCNRGPVAQLGARFHGME